ncbi:glycosyl hydrolase 2 galactose-binding domain-containing protein [Cellulomonas triticagri]|uniref:glycosyl hydrolase 2 galactose-binding domain-containing protein n=1 Tax=Cellulomonas triticagri TaxID=2483352 RepID=UPI001F2703CC|nr:glycoside hydrolase family 2 protein [Cellulomonas triticagri]
MQHLTLADGWTVTPTAGPVPAPISAAGPLPAAVPGSVHTDLLAAGLIADPYADDHEADLAWFHGTDWQYERALALAPAASGERVDLVLDGVDTVGRVALGTRVLGDVANMHRSYRYDVRDLADGRSRLLTVDLRSATAYGEEVRAALGERPSAYWPRPYNMVRKMACSFGWDWGPDLRTAGLWRPVRLERWSVARLAQVRPLVTLDADGTGRVVVHVDVERSGLVPDGDLTLRADVLGVDAEVVVPAGSATATLSLTVPDAPAWWPVGHGDQPLADLTVTLAEGATPLDTWTRRVGFRTVALDTSSDEHGTRFVLVVNGREIAVRGANWIPDDHLVTRITRERLDRRLDQAVGAHLNLLRVWGGGLYESADFYAACDERGLLVWQDFLLACAAYPEEEPLRSEIEAEARENVVRLMPHPSLVLWNGGNENLWGHEDWGWKDRLGDATWGRWYAEHLFPSVLAELDPSRPYAANSPFTPAGSDPTTSDPDRHPNDPDHGTHHQWEVWNRVDYTVYRTEVPRFCSEFGFQGPPAWRTLAESVHAVDGGPLADAPAPQDDPVFLVHQKADDGNGKLDRGMAPHLGVPADFADWHWAGQLNQARAVRHAVEHYRAWWPRTAGWIVWQLNDCWPVTSWAAVDSTERPKPLWFALRAASAPRAVFLADRPEGLVLVVTNDTDEPWTGSAEVRRESLLGVVAAAGRVPVDVAPRAVAVLPVPADVASPTDAASEVVLARFGTGDDARLAAHTFVEDMDLRLDPDALRATAAPEPGGYRVDVVARSYASDVALHADRLAADARVDDALVTLPAGERVTFHVRTAATLDLAALASAPVLRSANDLRGVPQREVGGADPAATTTQPGAALAGTA